MRYIPHTPAEQAAMLREIGVESLDALFDSVPAGLRLARELDLTPPAGEIEIDHSLKALADANRVRRDTPSFLGAGLYEHYIPHAVRQLMLRGEILTAYTPYQPEIAQGTLKIIFEFQSMTAELLGLDVANASMYDGAQAAAEGALMALRLSNRSDVLTLGGLHPEYRDVIKTYTENVATLRDELPLPNDSGVTAAKALADALGGNPKIGAVVVQSPNYFGCIEDVEALASTAREAGAFLVAVFNEPLAFALLKPPGACGAEIAAGEATGLGSAIGFGGPSLGLFATNKAHVRQMPGRLCGQTVDREGREGYVLTLSTREQHIRRERATSNICTNQGLCATAATIYLSLLGKTGLERLARLNLSRAEYAKTRLCELPGVALRYPTATFNEFTLCLPTATAPVAAACADLGLLPGLALGPPGSERANELLVAVTELHTRETIDRLVATVGTVLGRA